MAILFVVVTVTLTSLGRSNAAFYAAKATPATDPASGSARSGSWGDAGDAYTSPAPMVTATTRSRIAVGSHDNCGNTSGQLGNTTTTTW